MNSKQKLLVLCVCLGMLLITVFGVFSSRADQCSYHAAIYEGLQLSQLTQELEDTGLIGRIHGSDSSSQLFVLSVREPKNFFNSRRFSLLTKDEETQELLKQAKRHDRVCIQGEFISNPSPQKHILVKSIKLLEQWSGLKGYPNYQRKLNLPEELKEQESFVGKVHAIDAEGSILVVEYKNGVIPIFVQSNDYTKDLFRGDIVRIAYQIQPWPKQPTHLNLNLEADKPLEVLDSMVAWNGRQERFMGHLVKFPQSPQIKFDVYAIEVETLGVNRYFTLVNFSDLNEFQRIRDKLSKIWDNHLDTVRSGRNLLKNPKVMIEVSGQGNVVSPAQANPQILIDSADHIQQAVSTATSTRFRLS